jgi:hypothetical protein
MQLESSLKKRNFSGWSNESIIDLYENTLANRERQLTDLCIEIGTINDRLALVNEQLKDIEKEKNMLIIMLEKRVIIIKEF